MLLAKSLKGEESARVLTMRLLNQLGIIKSDQLVTIMRGRASVNGLNDSSKNAQKHGILPSG